MFPLLYDSEPSLSSIDDIATIDYHGMTLYEGGFRGAQEQCAVGNFLNSAHPFHRSYVDSGLQQFYSFLTASRHWCCNDPWTDCIDSDAMLGVVNGIATRHAYHCGFAGTVCRYTRSVARQTNIRQYSRALGRPTTPSWLAILTIDPRSPGRPSWLSNGSCCIICFNSALEESQQPR
jgi:hypothetical protein